ncbi:MAG: hypothetical protein ACLP9L_35775 [Thermoguttaceae bacterium]
MLKCKEADLAVEKTRRSQRIAGEEAKIAKAELERAKRKAADRESAPAVPGEKNGSGPAKAGTTSASPGPTKTTAAKRLTEEEIVKQRPWVVVGRVTDGQRQPIEGVTLRAHCGMGTLFETGITATDSNGRYTLRFAPGMYMLSEKAGEAPVNLQAATITARKPGFVEKNLCRQGNLTMADRVPPPDYPKWGKSGGPVLPNQPVSLDFVLVPAATIDVELLDAGDKPIGKKTMWLSGKELPPSCSQLSESKRGTQGAFRFEDVPPNFAWWFVVQVEPRHVDAKWPDEVRSPSMIFSQPGEYRVRLCLRRDAPSGLDLLEILSVRNAKGDEVRDQVVIDEPATRTPLPPTLQAKGREILAKMAEANRYWLDQPPPEIRTYRYDFKLRGKEPKTYTVSENGRAAGAFRQGISYGSVLNGLTAHPERVVFRQIDVQPNRMTLTFTLTDGAPVSAGNGVLGTWSGFFSMNVSEGTMIVDPKTYTLQECRSEIRGQSYQETLSDYAEIRPSHFVPLRVRVSSGDMAFDFRFRVYEPGLWLFASSLLKDSTMIAQVDNVVINGERAGQPVPAAKERTSPPPHVTIAPEASDSVAKNELPKLKAESTEATTEVPVEALYRNNSPGLKQIVLKEAAGMIRGQVIDAASGSPIQGAVISAQSLVPRVGYAGYRTSVSDENGRYILTSMAPGLWNVLFGRVPGKPDWTAVAVDALEVKSGEAAKADFHVAPGRLLSGVVIDAEKNVPLAGVSIGYYGPARPRSGAACLMVKTNPQGRFEFHVPPGESYVYVAQEFRGNPSSRTLIVESQNDPEPIVFRGVLIKSGGYRAAAAPAAETEALGGTLKDDMSYTFRGTLRTAGGKPVPGATIQVWSPAQVGYRETSRFLVQGGEFSSFLGIHFIDGQGRRQLKMEDQYYRNKIKKPWYLVIDAAGYARPKPIEFTFAKEIKPLAIVLERPVYVLVRGRALDGKGLPVAKANVSVSLSTVGWAVEEPWGPEYLTDKDGRFELKQVYLGNRFAVRIAKEHYVAAQSPRMLVENANPIDLGDLRLSAAEQR